MTTTESICTQKYNIQTSRVLMSTYLLSIDHTGHITTKAEEINNLHHTNKVAIELIPTGSVKYFSYSSSVYLTMSTDCSTPRKTYQDFMDNQKHVGL